MAYADRLERFTRWYVQLWAESLGKDGKGTTPIGALGPVDQHSQLQLFIAGPRDKLFTVVTRRHRRAAARASTPISPSCAGEPDFAGKTIGDLVAAQGRATAETLAKNGCPVRTIHIETLDEREPRRAADAFHAGDDHRRASARRRCRSTSRRWKKARCWRRSISPGRAVVAIRERRHDPHHRPDQHRRVRDRGELRALVRSRRAERQQALDRGAAALRRAPLAVAAERRGDAADAACRQAHDQGRRAGASSRRTTAPRSATAPRRGSGWSR